MMTYSLAFYESPADFERRESAEAPAYWGAWSAYIDELADAKVLVPGAGAALQPPSTATVVRGKDIQDGPVADTREQLAGFLLITVPSLDEAIVWAGKAPASVDGAVEIRPVLPPPAQ
ncbi:MAG: YciI family protein [Fimbriimonas sp.]